MLLTLARYQSTCPGLDQHFAVCFEGRLASDLEALGHSAHRLGACRASRPWTIYQARRTLSALLDVECYDWVLCHSAWPLGLLGPAVTKSETPLALWLHDAAHGKHWVERFARRAKPDIALCNSRYTANTLPTLFPALRAEVLHCPVPKPSTLKPGARTTTRNTLGANEQTTVILLAARFEEWKGHRVLFEALALLKNNEPWQCWIAGGTQRPHERACVEALKQFAVQNQIESRIQFLGQRNDVGALMAAADIYCQPNTAPEPFGISFVEALYAGLPVVTSNFGGAAEILTPDCGTLLPPGDAIAVANELRSLITYPAKRVGAAEHGPRRAVELCDPGQQINRLKTMLSAVKQGRTVEKWDS